MVGRVLSQGTDEIGIGVYLRRVAPCGNKPGDGRQVLEVVGALKCLHQLRHEELGVVGRQESHPREDLG